jgi:hypothetical protein
MKANTEKRACERHDYDADIALSYFNGEYTYDAETINVCTGGMCFKSDLRLHPGATLCIRLKKIHPNSTRSCSCEGLCSITLGEVKSYRELNGSTVMPYSVGVKYYPPIY